MSCTPSIIEPTTQARWLDRAAKRWPGEPRSRLLLRLVDVAGVALDHQEQRDAEAHRAAGMASSGRYADAFGPGCLAALREDWPG